MKNTWHKLNATGRGALGVIGLIVLAAITAYFFIPDKSENANAMQVQVAAAAPGTQVQVFTFPEEQKATFLKRYFSGTEAAANHILLDEYKIEGNKLIYREVGNPDWQRYEIPQGLKANEFIQTKKFILGTDIYGRDFFSRLILGARVSLAVGLIAVFISLLIGIPMGALAGFYKGWVDKVIMWLINVIWSIPTLLLVIALTFVLGKGFWQVFVAVGLTMWVEVARVVRGQVLGIREKEFVEAARVLGYSNFRILFKHILPNAISPVIVISAANFASAILIESGLSFLGIGAQPPTPSWGGMIRDHYVYVIMGKPFLALLPGLFIMISVLSFTALGNSLRDALDVKNMMK